MKARIKGTNTIVEYIETGTFINDNKGIECRHSNGAIEVIPGDCLVELEDSFDWQSFRAKAAKDILCALIHKTDNFIGKDSAGYAIMIADELIKQLKEKEEK